MKKVLIAGLVLFILFAQFVYATDSNGVELMDELSIHITNFAENPVYLQYYVGPSWDSATSKGSQLVPSGVVNLLAKEGVTCYAEIGYAGLSKNQGNVITINLYDNASPERKLLASSQEIVQHLYDKDITRDKGNYCHVQISRNYKLTTHQVQLFTGRNDMSGNLGRAAMHYRSITVRTFQGAILLGLISLFLFFKSIKNGMVIGSKISKLGLLFLVINSLAVIAFCVTDIVGGLETGSSGFALIPIIMFDFPASFIALFFGWLINQFFQCPLTNTNSIIDKYYIINGSIYAVSFVIFGGLQWYGVGWLIPKIISKVKGRFKKP